MIDDFFEGADIARQARELETTSAEALLRLTNSLMLRGTGPGHCDWILALTARVMRRQYGYGTGDVFTWLMDDARVEATLAVLERLCMEEWSRRRRLLRDRQEPERGGAP